MLINKATVNIIIHGLKERISVCEDEKVMVNLKSDLTSYLTVKRLLDEDQN